MAQIERAGSDIPTQAIPSSVGPLSWPPSIDIENNRKRGMFRRVIESGAMFNSLAGRFSQFELSDDVSRVSARIFITDSALRESLKNNLELIDPLVEAIIPLKGSGIPELDDVLLVYLGKNSDSRTLPQDEVNKEISRANEIFSLDEPPRYHSYEGIDFTVLDSGLRQDAEIQNQFADLYSAFGWNVDDVAKILNNQDNLLVAAFNQGLLISTGMAEKAIVPLIRQDKRFNLVMYEITEAATREEYRGNGLYLAVALIINRLLADGDANLVFGESNLSAPGVLKAAYRQGRHSTLRNLNEYGISEKPLRQPVRISGGVNDHRPKHLKNDLLVTYLVREDLIERHGNPSHRSS